MRNLFSEPIKKLKPWPFQEVAIDSIIEYRNSYKGKTLSGIIVAPTGAGKSLIIAHSVYKLAEPTLILQPSKELLEQNYEKYVNHGGIASIYSASAGHKNATSCTFATPGSVVGKGDLFRRILKIKILFIDECHFKVKTEKDKGKEDELGQVMAFIQDLQPEVIIGLTATPVRLSTSSMGPTINLITRTRHKLFHDFIHITQIQDVYDKYWKNLSYKEFDFDESLLRLNSTGTEFDEQSIKISIAHNNVNRSMCVEVLDLINGKGLKSILMFMDSVENGKRMAEWLVSKGIKAVCIDGKTPKKQRTDQVNDFKALKIQVLINYGTFTTGFDHPGLECVMMGRPTNSFAMLYQIIGRLVRIHPDIDTGLFVDFCNNIKRIGKINNITFEKIEGYGYGMFNGDRLMTGRPLNMKPLTKYDLKIRAIEASKTPYDGTVHFGKYKGQKVAELPLFYLNFCAETFKEPDGILMNKFMESVYERLNELND